MRDRKSRLRWAVMLIGSAYGRLGRDPERRSTRAGLPMVSASLAVDVGKPGADQQTLWLSLLAFGDMADALAKLAKGECLSVVGKLTREAYIAQDGSRRETWGMVVDGLVTARSARPGGGASTKRRKPAEKKPALAAPTGPDPELNDSLPWLG